MLRKKYQQTLQSQSFYINQISIFVMIAATDESYEDLTAQKYLRCTLSKSLQLKC